MAEPSSSKPVIVRVKRKATQARLDSLWLEINERPTKKAFLDFQKLSLTESDSKVEEEPRTKKLLAQHVETVSHTKATKEVLQSLLPNSAGSNDSQKKIEERRNKQYKPNPEIPSALARKKHEELVRNARFEQIWRSRRESKGADDSLLRDLCHIYDVVRVDSEDEISGNAETITKCRDVPAEDDAILCNFLPLMREFIPTAAEEIESDMKSYLKEDNFVYDLYTVEDKMQASEEGSSTDYPLVHVRVDEEDYWYDGPDQNECESDDSNAEDNPRNDYPDESGSEDEEDSNKDDADSDSDEDDDEDSDENDSRASSGDNGYEEHFLDSDYEEEIGSNEESSDEDTL